MQKFVCYAKHFCPTYSVSETNASHSQARIP